MASQLQKQVYQAYLDAGLSPNQARIITAEVGRENSFNPNTVFGVHLDPKNKALNLGMLSWQGSRGKSLYNYMHSKGLIQNGAMVRNQAALNEMARFSVNEMRNNKSYAQTAKTFLSNPDIDYQTGAAVLGKNYIRWRYDDPKYKSGHQNRDHFYRAMGGNIQQQQKPFNLEVTSAQDTRRIRQQFQPDITSREDTMRLKGGSQKAVQPQKNHSIFEITSPEDTLRLKG